MTDLPPEAERVESILAELLEAPPEQLESALESACAEHPELAGPLRERMAFLRNSGLLQSISDAGDSAPARGLRAGDRVLDFEVLDELGVGGMGEVYRALDTRLRREVAIKILPEHLATDPVRLKRFSREARTVAGLNHANIAQIHHLDRSGGREFLVLELVPGEDLATILRQGPLATETALDFALQLARGLEAAHEAGVVHRDLKPANVRVTPDGVLKILDFGLAKDALGSSWRDALAEDEDSVHLTQEGTLLGTPVYMSPEQIRGRRTDRRADIWAFGCILFECLTGERPFNGQDFAELAAAVLHEQPNWSAVPHDLHPAVLRLLGRCLEKDPQARLRDIGEARILLGRVLDGTAEADAGPPALTRSGRGERAVWVAGLALAGLVGWTASAGRTGDEDPSAAFSLSALLGPDHRLEARNHANLAISTDRSTIAWVGGTQRCVFVRRLDGFEILEIPDSRDASSPFLSPDGEWVGFFIHERLWKARVDGSAPIELFDERAHANEIRLSGTENRGAAWCADDSIVFCPSVEDGLFRIQADGSRFTRLTEPDATRRERTHRWPAAIPGARRVLFTIDDDATTESYDDATVASIALDGGEIETLVEGASFGRATEDALVFVRGVSVYLQPFADGHHALRGVARPLLPEVRVDRSSGAAMLDVSADGSLCYAPGAPIDAVVRLAFRDEAGDIEYLTQEPGAYLEPALSPDGTRVAYVASQAGATDLCVLDLTRGLRQQLTTNGACFSPTWHPDGRSITYLSRDPAPWGMYRIAIDQGSEPELLFETQGDWAAPYSYADNGSELLFVWQRDGTGRDICRLDLESGEPQSLVATTAAEEHPALSPNGRWLAYTSDRSRVEQVYLMPMDGTQDRIQASHSGGSEPRWSADGSRITYLNRAQQELWAVDVSEVDGRMQVSKPRRLLANFLHNQNSRFQYQVAPDGRFLTTVPHPEASDVGREIRFVEAWATVDGG